jgi:MFS family permease
MDPIVANARNGPRRRLPIEFVLLGAACLVCCLPLLAGLAITATGVLAGLAATRFGVGLAVATGIAVGAGVVALAVRLFLRRRLARGTTCGGSHCAC